MFLKSSHIFLRSRPCMQPQYISISNGYNKEFPVPGQKKKNKKKEKRKKKRKKEKIKKKKGKRKKIKEKRKNNKKKERNKKERKKQKAISTLAPYSSLRGSRPETNLYRRMVVDGGGRARVVEKKHVFREYLKNYSILFPNCFASPQKRFQDIFCEKLKKI